MRLLPVAVIAALTLAGGVQAQTTTTWVPTEEGDWLTAVNWDAGVPSSVDEVVIASGGTANLTGIGSAGELKIGSGGGTSGFLTIDGGTLSVDSNAAVGFYYSTGSAGISAGSWTTAGAFFVGHIGGVGSLDIAGGTVTSATSYVGYGGAGTVGITGGSWSAGSLYVGVDATQDGAGVLTVDGGSVTATSVRLNYSLGYATSTATVNLNGGVLAAPDLKDLTGGGGGHLNFNGGTLRATANSGDFLAGFTAGGVQIAAGGATVDTQGFAVTVNPSLQGAGGLTKIGAGALTLTGTSTYTGGTAVSAGTLKVSGSIASSSLTTVASGATLTGTGTVGALDIQAGGTIAPGNSPGTLSAGNTAFGADGGFDFEINRAGGGLAGTNWDLLSISGALTIDATSADPFVIHLTSLTLGNVAGLADSFNPASSYSFIFATAADGITGFSADKFMVDTTGFQNAFTEAWAVASDGYNLALTYNAASAVPEPSTYAALAGAAVLALACWRRQRRPATP